MAVNFDQIKDSLRATNRYRELIERYEVEKNRGYAFEILFANAMEQNGLRLEYEKNILLDEGKSIDFHLEYEGNKFRFELVSIDTSDPIKETIKAQQERNKQEDGCTFYGVVLTSNAENPHLDHGAQVIRLQEKVLKKPAKFDIPNDDTFNIIVADCSEIHSGMFDFEDLGNVMNGRTKNPAFQDHFKGNRIIGLLEKDHKGRGAKEFRENISALICIKKMKPDLFSHGNVIIAYNDPLGSSHVNKLKDCLRKIKLFNSPEPA